jgi:heptosyltransferase III
MPAGPSTDRRLEKRVLFIQARNLGDAVIGTSMIEALGRSDEDWRISVLTRPQFREIYANNPLVSDMHYASFPMGTVKNFGVAAGLNLLRTVASLRGRHFDRVVHVCGDFRENLLGWTISRLGNTGVSWADEHPQVRLVRRGFENYVPHLVHISASEPNIYSVMQRVATALQATAPARARLYDAAGKPYIHRSGSDRIGVQPTASQECKLWPIERWQQLISVIRASGLKVAVFGAPTDRPYLEACLPSNADSGVEIVTGPLQSFFRSLESLRVLVGLDSFGVHAANAIGTPTIMINGANIPTVWTPPGTPVVSNTNPPACYPCMNRPTCTADENPYSCIREIPLAAVTDNLRNFGVLIQ